MKELHPELQKRIEDKIEDYKKVTAFAKKLPVFAREIIDGEYTGGKYCQLRSQYKHVNFSWAIKWNFTRPLNYPEDEPCKIGLVSVYINCFNFFHEDMYSFALAELNKSRENIDSYFYDSSNSTFYFTPEQTEAGLDAIVEWYDKTRDKTEAQLKETKRKRLEAELKALDR